MPLGLPLGHSHAHAGPGLRAWSTRFIAFSGAAPSVAPKTDHRKGSIPAGRAGLRREGARFILRFSRSIEVRTRVLT
jgi:hypothetical protein